MSEFTKPVYIKPNNTSSRKAEVITRCEACNAVIPEEHLWPKPICRLCGWVWSCCNPV